MSQTTERSAQQAAAALTRAMQLNALVPYVAYAVALSGIGFAVWSVYGDHTLQIGPSVAAKNNPSVAGSEALTLATVAITAVCVFGTVVFPLLKEQGRTVLRRRGVGFRLLNPFRSSVASADESLPKHGLSKKDEADGPHSLDEKAALRSDPTIAYTNKWRFGLLVPALIGTVGQIGGSILADRGVPVPKWVLQNSFHIFVFTMASESVLSLVAINREKAILVKVRRAKSSRVSEGEHDPSNTPTQEKGED